MGLEMGNGTRSQMRAPIKQKQAKGYEGYTAYDILMSLIPILIQWEYSADHGAKCLNEIIIIGKNLTNFIRC